MFNEQLASQTVVDQAAAKLLAENQIKLQKEKNLTSSRTSTSGPGSTGFGKDPFRSNGIYDITLGTTNDTQWWMGPGMNDKDKTFLNQQKSDFLSLTSIQNLGITAEMFNELSNDSTITFDDGGFWEGGDSFNFTHEGKTYNVGHTNGWEDAISEVIQNKYLKTQSTRQIDRTNYWVVFTKNNPEYVEKHGLEVAKDKFMSIYNKNGVGSRKVYSDDLATEIFGIMSDAESSSSSSSSSSNNNNTEPEKVWDGTNFVDPPEEPEERTDNLAQINRVLSEAVKQVGGPIENELTGMSRPELQNLYDTLSTRQKNLEKIGQVLKGDELDLFNALTKALGS